MIGAPKCGTTTLYQYLATHPSVFMCQPKEPQFFSKDDLYRKGIDWYKGLFKDATDEQLCGDASTTYSRWPSTPDVPLRMKDAGLCPRFIYALRNPADRAYSAYQHHMRHGVSMTFEEALVSTPRYRDVGLYKMQLERYLRFFDLEQFHFVLFDELVADAPAAVSRLCAFLGVKTHDVDQCQFWENKSGSDEFMRHHTTDRLKSLPLAGSVIRTLPPSWRRAGVETMKRSPIGKAVMRRHRIPPFQPETRRRLLREFESANRELESMLDIDLSSWMPEAN